MTWLEYAAWGAFGGFAVEGLEFYSAIRRVGTWPWTQPGEPGFGPLAVSVVIRLLVGAGLATALGLSNQLSGPVGAMMAGVAAPLLVEQLARQVSATGQHGQPQQSDSAVNGHEVDLARHQIPLNTTDKSTVEDRARRGTDAS